MKVIEQPVSPQSSISANFPVRWEQPGDEHLFWKLSHMHSPDPLTPMAFDFARYCYDDGASQSYPHPRRVISRRINTYLYRAVVPIAASAEEIEARERRAEEQIRSTMTRLAEAWASEWLPEVKEHLRYWEHFDLRNASMPALLDHLEETIRRTKRL